MDTRRFDVAALTAAQDRVVERIEGAEASGYREFTAGELCRWCPHNTLPCGPDGATEWFSTHDTDQ